MRRIRYVLAKWWRRVVRVHDSPHAIATGASIGMFVAMVPIYGFQLIVAASLAAVARVNKLAAIVAVWVTNPLTIPAILYAQYHMGRLVVGGEEVSGVWPRIGKLAEAAAALSPLELKDTSRAVFVAIRGLGWEILWPTLIGSVVSGVLLGLMTYPATLRAVLWYRRTKEAARARRRERLAARLAESAPGAAETPPEDRPEGAENDAPDRREAASPVESREVAPPGP